MTATELPLDRSPKSATRCGRSAGLWGLSVFLVAAAVFGFDLQSERPFADESAYYSQSYFARLYAEGRWNDPAWLTYPAFDLPPLPKYLIGAALAADGIKTPGPREAFAWYRNTSMQWFEPAGALTVARLPSVLLGAVGCLAVYGLGVLVSGRALGVVAALLLTANPLYRLLARRAMSDMPCEAFLLLTLLLGLLVWSRMLAGRWSFTGTIVGAGSGVCAGLSLSCKLSGSLSLMVLATWVVLAIALTGPSKRSLGFAVSMLLAVAAASVTLVALNPFLTAHPTSRVPQVIPEIEKASVLERARRMADLRLEVARGQKDLFPHNALWTASDKASSAAVQGFGRFGPFGPSHSDSTRRYDAAQDWGALIWLPWTALGAVWAFLQGRTQWRAGVPPTSWALLVQFVVTLAVVTAYLPMAWDRYFLSVQAPASLMAAGAAVAVANRVIQAAFPRPKGD
jgi:4-amino-4-deoxy-L-arabinose transferase-like glycosyltransferase